MKKILLLFLLFVSSFSAYSDYYRDRIFVKFRPDSPQFIKWSASLRKGEIEALLPFIGHHSSEPFINEQLISDLNSKNKKDNMLSTSPKIEPLSLISIVIYKNEIDPLVLSKKLSSMSWIDYAEPVPKNEIISIPDDPKINGEYFLDTINVFRAWDFIDSTKNIVAGIVDTGIDYLHEDISQNVFINPGEDGLDSNGKDKRTNGIDDDHNGFIDDWHGWDFSSSDSSGQDNNPAPGHKHGTHVAGIVGAATNNGIGIASVGRYVKLMGIKAAGDNPLATSVDHGYEGLLYGAIAGAKVINCSWGSTTRSESEAAVVAKVLELGTVIVAAAGNNNYHETFFPAGYRGVISVAALNSANEKASYSNFSETVDVSAPGDDILSTVPNNNYEFMSGTSMASPVVTGVAALARLAHPDYNPYQIHELIRMTSDDIYGINPKYNGLLGKGRVNALRVVTDSNVRSMILQDYKIVDEDGDGIITQGEMIQIFPSFGNILSPVSLVRVKVNVDWFDSLAISKDSINLGKFATGEIKSPDSPVSFRIPMNIGFDYDMKIRFEISDSIGHLNTEIVSLLVNPSYRDMNANNISTTFNSRGNIGFNDYPDNMQGSGFRYKNSANILFEGALMIGAGYDRISDCARGLNQNEAEHDFMPIKFLTLEQPGKKAELEATMDYFDNNDTAKAGVHVMQHIYQSNATENQNFILTSYDIFNQSNKFQDSLYVGLFFDWDIGPSGSDNQCDFDNGYQFGFVRNVKNDTLPWAGVQVLSENRVNYYAIDNGGTGDENGIGIYNGFSKREKWTTLTGGIRRKKSSVTDVSMVLSAGPIRMLPGDTSRVIFALLSGNNIDDLRKASQSARKYSDEIGLNNSTYPVVPAGNTITSLYPNPSQRGSIKIKYTIVEKTQAKIELYDPMGRFSCRFLDKESSQGRYELQIPTNNLSSGIYYLLLRTDRNTQFSAICITN